GTDYYWLFVVLHSSWLVSLSLESIFLAAPIPSWWPFFLALIIAAQLLRYWAIITLGYRWNTRIVVFAHAGTILSGPYRYLRHPNYVAVALEIFFIPALLGAWYSAIAFSVLNALLLLLIRIPQEERALKDAGQHAGKVHASSTDMVDEKATSKHRR
ncbi:MAG: isoprenylcysteine carboxylmethyltransferase family protein, partial [Desulfofustis sp.]